MFFALKLKETKSQLTHESKLIFAAEATAILALEKLFHLSSDPDSALYYFLAQPESKVVASKFSKISHDMKQYLPTEDEKVDGNIQKNQHAAYLYALSQIRSTCGHSMSQYLADENPELGYYFRTVLPDLKVINEAFMKYLHPNRCSASFC
jgi:hypothetical protein